MISRFGPRLGLTTARLRRTASLIERRGRPVLVAGRAIPGLRTLTVIAAGASGLSPGRALPALIASVFLQVHLFLGYFLGAAAVHLLHAATGTALGALAVVLAGGIVFWFTRRRRRPAAGGLAEAACPACLAVAYLAERPGELHALVTDAADPDTGQPVDPPPGPGPERPRHGTTSSARPVIAVPPAPERRS